MFGSNSWYFDAPDGRRFNWNKQPTYVCPNFDPIESVHVEHDVTTGEPATVLVLRDAHRERIESAAALLGVDAVKLGRMFRKQHQSFTHSRERVNGKLTDKCACCGHKMDRLGFRCWIDQPKPKSELTSEDRVSSAVSERLGFDGERRVTVRSFYTDTKKEAEAWARDELATAKAIAEEEAQARV